QTSFEALIAIADPDTVAVAVTASPAEQVGLQYAGSNFSRALGTPVIGRSFEDDDDRVGAEPVVVVSHRFWTTRLGSADVTSLTTRVNNVPVRIVGVAPRGFFG